MGPAPRRRLVALDVDGTILNADDTVSRPVVEAIAAAARAGHEVMLATGRSWEAAEPVMRKAGIRSRYVVCANGAITMKRDPRSPGGYRRFHIDTFDAHEVLATIRPRLPDGRFLVEDATGFRRYTEAAGDWLLERAEKVPFDRLAEVPATRVVVVSPGHDEEDFFRVVESMGLHRVSYSIGWTAWLDISPEGVTKATALERVRELLGFERRDVICVGDGRNDIEMLRWAAEEGRGVAMGHASDDVVAAANEVTGSIDDDGVAALLAAI
ncbi:MAG TPA: HAD family hydrolase [Microbacteriaceae bacterium]|nr:HAD family hydrolase [Microbacteriaceae bacterium]